MRHVPCLLLAATLLAACAPGAGSPDRLGRIVNVTSGAEGRLTLGGGGVVGGQGRATIAFGQDVYYGEYNVLAPGGQSGVVLGAGIAFGTRDPFFDTNPWPQAYSVRDSGPRTGSIIVKSGSGAVISCTMTVDRQSHGNGTCEDGAGNNYAFQF